MLLVLQRRGRMTAPALAAEFEVSERTILRDVEALSEAGVPIFTTRGAGGGIDLMDGFQTHLTGLTDEEARCLFLVGQPQVAHRLGLAAPTLTARNKLLNAIAPALADHADDLATWFVHDPDPWTGNRIPHGELRRIARCIHQHRKVELAMAHKPAITVQPLGLALKAASWHVISARRRVVDVICLDELRGDAADEPALHAAGRLRPRGVLERVRGRRGQLNRAGQPPHSGSGAPVRYALPRLSSQATLSSSPPGRLRASHRVR